MRGKFIIAPVVMAVAMLGLCASQADAAVDPGVNGLIGNTLIQSGETWEHHTWYNANGAYVTSGYDTVNGVTGMGGEDGTYAVQGGKLCQTSRLTNKSVCGFQGLKKKLGDKWDVKRADGQTEHFEVGAGHQ